MKFACAKCGKILFADRDLAPHSKKKNKSGKLVGSAGCIYWYFNASLTKFFDLDDVVHG